MIDSVALSTVAKSAFEDSMGGSSAVGSNASAGVSETPFASVLHGAMEQMGNLEQDADNKVTGILLSQLGNLYRDIGRFADAEKALKSAVAILERGGGPEVRAREPGFAAVRFAAIGG